MGSTLPRSPGIQIVAHRLGEHADRLFTTLVQLSCAAVISGSTKVLAREETMLVQACPHGPRPAASRPPPTDPNRPRSASAPSSRRAVAGRGRHAAAQAARVSGCGRNRLRRRGERFLAEGRDGQVDRERRGHAARRQGPRHSQVPGSAAPSPQPHWECPPRRRVPRAPGAALRGGRADVSVAQSLCRLCIRSEQREDLQQAVGPRSCAHRCGNQLHRTACKALLDAARFPFHLVQKVFLSLTG